MRPTWFALIACCAFVSEAFAQTPPDSELTSPAARWREETARDHHAPAPNLTGTSFAFSVAGGVYAMDGHRLRLPGAINGWEDDIQLGFGVFRALGRSGHIGAGVGLGEDEDVAVSAHMAMRW